MEGKLSISPNRTVVGIGCIDIAVGASDPVAQYPPNPQRVSTFFGESGSVVLQHAWGGEILTFILSAVLTKERMYTSGHTDILTADVNGNNQYKMASNPVLGQYARTLRVFGNNLYMHDDVNFFLVGTPGSGLPTSGPLTALISGSGTSFRDFVMFDVSTTVKGYDLLYLVDASSSGVLRKYTYDGTTWNAQGTTTVNAANAITGEVDSSGNVILYIATPNFVVKYSDLTMLSVVANGGEFFGVSMAPHALCADGSKTTSIGESDVDCGGNSCEKCENGKTCVNSLDCLENTCVNNVCGT